MSAVDLARAPLPTQLVEVTPTELAQILDGTRRSLTRVALFETTGRRFWFGAAEHVYGELELAPGAPQADGEGARSYAITKVDSYRKPRPFSRAPGVESAPVESPGELAKCVLGPDYLEWAGPGLHAHALRMPEGAVTVGEDGAHIHGFWHPDLGLLWTEEGGGHTHEFSADGTGAHVHRIPLADGEPAATEVDGAHGHDLAVRTTAFDGAHQHAAQIAGQRLLSLTAAELRAHLPEDVRAMEYPPAPPATYLAKALRTDVRDDAEDAAEKRQEPSGRLLVLKVPDPTFSIERLRDAKSAGLLSRRPRRARVGVRQFLVNETQGSPTARRQDPTVWGVVALGEPQEFPSLAEVPDELAAGLDAATRREFSTEAPVFYLPLKLIAAYDPPIELRETPPGRRFAGSIDLASARK